MKRVLSMLVVVGLMVLLFAPVATAQYYGGGGSTASSTAMSTATPTASATATTTATATATATASATALPKSGGPPGSQRCADILRRRGAGASAAQRFLMR